MPYENESILVIRRSQFDALGAFQGFSKALLPQLPAFQTPEHSFFTPREAAETDPTHKQIIPYALFHHNGRLLHYVRGGKSGEKRLASKGSIGIGGHINTTDSISTFWDRETYEKGVEREVNEELQIQGSYTQRIVGMINDDSNEVGQVHLGIVHVFDLESDQVSPNEAPITELEFLTRQELLDRQDRLESWSALIVQAWDEIFV